MQEKEKAAEFVASTGMFMAAIDGKVEPAELEALKRALSNFTSQPEKYLQFTDLDDLIKRLATICVYVAELDELTKSLLLGMILGVAISDGVLHGDERKSLYKLAEMLEIDKEDIDAAIEMVLE